MKILVTGGLGYIGAHTAVELVGAGHQPILLDTLERSDISILGGIKNILGREVDFVKGDCADRTVLDGIYSKYGHIDGVIHFAAYKAVGESVQNPLIYYKNNIGSTVTLIEFMLEKGIADLVFSSSCTVYGQPEQLPVTEESPVLPAQSPYGNTKQICEEIMRDTVNSGAKFRGLALRYFNPIGAHPTAEIGELPIGTPNNLAPFITQTAIGLRNELKVFGNDYPTPDGTAIRDYIHVVDLAKAHVKAIEWLIKNPAEKLFDFVNLGTGKGSSVLEVINAFEKVSGVKLNYSFAPRRPGDVTQVYAGVEKSKSMLGWQTELSLDDCLADAWRWEQKIRK